MKNITKINLKSIILISIIILAMPIAFAGFFDSVSDFWESVTGKATNQNFNVSISLANTAPVIVDIEDVNATGYSSTAGTTTTIIFWYTARDDNGCDQLVDASSSAAFSNGGVIRTDVPCTRTANISGTVSNFSCTVNMNYYDDGGVDWIINVTINDSIAAAYNDTTNFTYGQNVHINISDNNLTWSAITTSSTNEQADNAVNVEHIGNWDIADMGVTGYNLTNGASTYIYAANFSAANVSTCPNGIDLVHGSEQTVTGSVLTHGQDNNKDIEFCLIAVPAGCSGDYTSPTEWNIVGNT